MACMGCRAMSNPFWNKDEYETLKWYERLGIRDPQREFIRELLKTHAMDDTVSERYIKHVLTRDRWRRAAQPWLDLCSTLVTPMHIFYDTVRGIFEKAAADEVPPIFTLPQAPLPPLFSNYGGGFSFHTSRMVTTTVTPVGSMYPGPGPIAGYDIVRAPEFEDAGISTGEVTGFRAWLLHDDGLLHSMYMHDFAWAPGIPVEGGVTPTHHGVHAFKTRESVVAYASDYGSEWPVVFGTVELWGTVYEHERGYRASHAAVASIEDAPSDDCEPEYDAAKLRKKYGLVPPVDPATEIPE